MYRLIRVEECVMHCHKLHCKVARLELLTVLFVHAHADCRKRHREAFIWNKENGKSIRQVEAGAMMVYIISCKLAAGVRRTSSLA